MLKEKASSLNDHGTYPAENKHKFRDRYGNRASDIFPARQVDLARELRQTIEMTLYWYDYFSRFSKYAVHQASMDSPNGLSTSLLQFHDFGIYQRRPSINI